MDHKNWTGFSGEKWKENIDVRSFIQDNYTPYTGDESFLSGPTERTRELFSEFEELLRQEQEKGGVLDVDTEHVSSLTNYQPAYLDKDRELIVGYQTEKPLTRGVNPFGGIRMGPVPPAKLTATSCPKRWKRSSPIAPLITTAFTAFTRMRCEKPENAALSPVCRMLTEEDASLETIGELRFTGSTI